MSDSKSAVRKALKQAASICKTSLTLLPEQHNASSSSCSSVKITPVHESLPPIYVDLLQTIRTHTTSVALSFQPPITPDGALSYLSKLQDGVARLVSCVVAAAGDDKDSARESILVEDWATAARRVTEDVLALVSTLLEHLDEVDNWEKPAKDEKKSLPDVRGSQSTAPYLSRTASVWDTIDQHLKVVAGTEAQAVQQRWTQDMEAMTDAWTEYAEMLEDAEDEDVEEDEEDEESVDEDDEWAGLEKELMGGGKMSADELARAKKAKPVLQLARILHRSVLKALTSHPTSYRPLLKKSKELAAAYDNAISSMYAPQEIDEVENAFTSVIGTAKNLAACFEKGHDGLDTAMANLAVSEGFASDRRKVEDFLQKWSPKMDEEVVKWQK